MGVVLVSSVVAFAHEGHAPLPTRGIEVSQELGRLTLTAEARATLDLKTEEISLRRMSRSTIAYGDLLSPWTHHALVSAPLSGRIVELFVRAGQTVQRGQPLAELESPSLSLLKLEYQSATSSMELSQKLLASIRQAGVEGSVPESRLIEAESQLEQNQIRQQIARARWVSFRLDPQLLVAPDSATDRQATPRMTLASPIDGVVTHLDLAVGKIVDPKEHLFEIRDLTTLWLRIGVLERDLGQFTTGNTVQFRPVSSPDRMTTAIVDVKGQQLDPITHEGTVWTTLNQAPDTPPEQRLLPGMSGQVQLLSERDESRLAIPADAVLRDGAERFVLVEYERTKEASRFWKQPVTLGARTGDWVEVIGGNVFPADRVVTQGSHELGGFFAKGRLHVNEVTARDIGLQVEPVTSRIVPETLTIAGQIDILPNYRTTAAAHLGGVISQIHVDRGQNVKAGDLLAEVLSPDFQNLQLEMLEANLQTRLLQKNIDRLRRAGDAVSQRRLWELESQLAQAAQQIDSARERLKSVGVADTELSPLLTSSTLIQSLPVRAPIDGIILDFDKTLGHIVQPEESLFEIHDPSHALILGFVPETELPRVQIGQTVRSVLVADPDEVIEGRVASLGNVVGVDDHTMPVWVEMISMPRLTLQHNMLAQLTIETNAPFPSTFAATEETPDEATPKGAITGRPTVPLLAIVREGTRAYVFVRVEKNVFERRYVESGRADDRFVEILSGVELGDMVAIRGVSELQTGYAALK
jgi:cobalt-zinc-cadmium efflux system membrane fusion protein